MTLLGIFPVFGLPGNWEYYVSPGTNEWIVVHGATINSLALWSTDNLDRPLSAINNNALEIGIDFVEKTEH